uniref:phage antirepressor N-terminal domain-containing protein n=1 Tax=Enterocloster clostridioformis TaxID=1531 RepID=UPI00267022A3|nr:phage antirepressor N-terminal domain-containing protein [Enterocloster clostridioformis]
MNDLVVKNVPFCGTELLAVQERGNGKIYAGINLLLAGLGFNEYQTRYRREKWLEDKSLSKGVRKFSHPSDKGGMQEAYCINITKLPLALAKLEITPKMEKEMPELSAKLEEYQDRCADVLAEAFLPKKEKQDKPKKESRASVNMTVKTIDTIFSRAGVDPLYIAVEAKRIYAEAGYDIKIPLITDKETMSKLYDCTSLAEAVGAYSEKGNPHTKAISAILQKLTILESEIVTTPYSRNGHDGVTIQYKPSVLEKVREWLEENYYPTKIPYTDSKGKQTICTVVYRDM